MYSTKAFHVQGQGPLVDKLLSIREWKDVFVCTISGAIVQQFDGSPVKFLVQVLFNLIKISVRDRDGV